MTPEAQRTDAEVAALVRGGYDVIADRYAAAVASEDPTVRNAWLDQLLAPLTPASRVLEIGCGPGVPTARDITAMGHHLTGVDISANQLALATARVPGAEFMCADVLHVTFSPASFDAVLALYSLTHVPRRHYVELFGRIAGWLRPGGRFLASFGSGDSAGWLEEDFLGFDDATNWTNSFDPDTTVRLVGGAGLAIERAEVVEHETPFGPERWLFVLAVRS